MKLRSHFTERLGLHPKSRPTEEAPKSPFQTLMAAVRKRFGAISPVEVSRLKRLRPEQQEHLLDVVVLAESVEFFLSQIPKAEPVPLNPRNTNTHLTHNLGKAMQMAMKTDKGQAGEKEVSEEAYDQPPPAPEDPGKLAEAVSMLRNWREIAGAPAQRYRLKDILSRFPRNNYVASIWLEHFEPILAERLPAGPPAAPSPLLPAIVTAANVPETILPEVAESIPEPESEPTEPMSTQPKADFVHLTDDEADVRIDVSSALTQQSQTVPVKSGISFEVPTVQPFTAEMRMMQSAAADPAGKRQVVVVLTVPEEDLFFAQGVARRVKGFSDLETRLAETARAYFVEAEQELATFRPAPAVAPVHSGAPAADPRETGTNPVVAEKKRKPRAKAVLAKPEKAARQLKPASSPRKDKSAPIVIPANQPAPPAVSETDPTPVPTEAIPGAEPTKIPRKTPEQRAAETVFYDEFNVLAEVIRAQVGPISKIFSTSGKFLVRGVLKRASLPHPSSFLKLLNEFTQLPLPQRKAIWPQLEIVIEKYKAIRREVQAYKLIEHELASVYGRLAER